ncbi:MAG: LysM peptidoglycan-binding domain-containing protein [Tepidisphaera sp.]|nr:LysM peptidoglycan-binding domain-containing protein [Tepidisphaera sp.]
MTRELKLSLIVGFVLVLVVAMLFSDYLSKANHTELEAKLTPQPQLTHPAPQEPVVTLTGRESAQPGPMLDVPPQNPSPAGPANSPAPSASASEQATPFTLVQGKGQSGSDFSGLKNAVEQIGGKIANGEIHVPGAVSTTLKEPPAAQPGPSAQPTPTDHSGDIRRPNTPVPHEVAPRETSPASAMREYTIAEGDSVYKIAKKFYNDGEQWKKIAAANPGKIGPKGEIRVGVLLKIPDVAPAAGSTPAASPAKAESSKNSGATGTARTYTVQKGDSLQSIAAKQLKSASRADELLKLNSDQVKDADMIRVGMVLKLPAK